MPQRLVSFGSWRPTPPPRNHAKVVVASMDRVRRAITADATIVRLAIVSFADHRAAPRVRTVVSVRNGHHASHARVARPQAIGASATWAAALAPVAADATIAAVRAARPVVRGPSSGNAAWASRTSIPAAGSR